MRLGSTPLASAPRRGGRLALPALLAASSLTVACASTVGPAFTADDASVDMRADASTVDVAPTIDAPSIDAPSIDVAIDRTVDRPRVDVFDAPPPLDVCAADTMSDPRNCGACGRACRADQICQFSLCVTRVDCPPSCAASSDCMGCLVPGDRGRYCCLSGLCLYSSLAECPVFDDRPPTSEPEDPTDRLSPPSDLPYEAASGDVSTAE